MRNVVTQPVCLDAQHKGVNHDKSDARELATRLDRYVAGNTRAAALTVVPARLRPPPSRVALNSCGNSL